VFAHIPGFNAVPVEDGGKIALFVLLYIVPSARRTAALRTRNDPTVPGKQIHEKLFQTASDFLLNHAAF